MSCFHSTRQGLVHIQQPGLHGYWYALMICTTSLSSFPISWKGQQQQTTPISCSMQNTAKLSYLQHEILWHAVSHKLFLQSKPISTALWFTSHINMYVLMCLQATLPIEWLITCVTSKWLLPSMYALMSIQITLPTEWLITYITAKWPLSSMYALMFLQITLLTEWLITYITAKWPLSSMYALMFLQITLLTEWLITYITAKWPLSSMYALMFLQITLLTEWHTYITAKW
jgi:hypothetical protein